MSKNLFEQDYREIITHLKRAYNAAQRLMCVSEDWTAKYEVEEEFRSLRDTIREFAECQCGVEIPPKKRN